MLRKISLQLFAALALLAAATVQCQAQSLLTHHVREAARTG